MSLKVWLRTLPGPESSDPNFVGAQTFGSIRSVLRAGDPAPGKERTLPSGVLWSGPGVGCSIPSFVSRALPARALATAGAGWWGGGTQSLSPGALERLWWAWEGSCRFQLRGGLGDSSAQANSTLLSDLWNLVVVVSSGASLGCLFKINTLVGSVEFRGGARANS